MVVENTGHQNVMSVSLLRLRSGRIASSTSSKTVCTIAGPGCSFPPTKPGETWFAPALVVDAPGYFVLNNDRVIQLNTGGG